MLACSLSRSHKLACCRTSLFAKIQFNGFLLSRTGQHQKRQKSTSLNSKQHHTTSPIRNKMNAKYNAARKKRKTQNMVTTETKDLCYENGANF
jgi:hypothetical protein